MDRESVPFLLPWGFRAITPYYRPTVARKVSAVTHGNMKNVTT